MTATESTSTSTPSSQGLGITYTTMSLSPTSPTSIRGGRSLPRLPRPFGDSNVQPPISYPIQMPLQHLVNNPPNQPQSYYTEPNFHHYNSAQTQSENRHSADGRPQGDIEQGQTQNGLNRLPVSSTRMDGREVELNNLSPSRNENRQPAFSLRPTHSRGSASMSFGSVSERPTASPHSVHGQRDYRTQSDPFAMPLPYSPHDLPVRRLPPPPNAQDSLSSADTSISRRLPQLSSDSHRSPSRASTSTGASVSSKNTKGSRTTDLIQRFAKIGESPAGKTMVDEDRRPLMMEDENEDEPEQAVDVQEPPPSPPAGPKPVEESPTKPVRRPLPRPSSQSKISTLSPRLDEHESVQSGTPKRMASTSSQVSSSGATASQSHPTPLTTDKSASSLDMFNPTSFPMPPTQVMPDPSFSYQSDHPFLQPRYHDARAMARSVSQPMRLSSVAEAEHEVASSRAASHMDHETKRHSDFSLGVHSKNAALISAETGGMMLAYSPSGGTTWREGGQIFGTRSSLMPTPQVVQAQTVSQSVSSRPRSLHDEKRPISGDAEAELKARPWSESTMSEHGQMRPAFMRTRIRSHSDGAAILARQGTLLHPDSSSKRASEELGVMLGNKSRRTGHQQLLTPPETALREVNNTPDRVRLEAAKKRKARVEISIALERECVVEGAEVQGRMDVRVTGGKRSHGLRVGGGKIRVVGFEEIRATSRHIFYHQTQSLPVFEHPASPDTPRSSLFASSADPEGYRVAAEGDHCIPFRMRLPFNGGAKGSYTSPNGKMPCVRYVVVGSIKIHIPGSGKRSIAHFYRQIVILPYLNPALALMPSPEPIEERVEKGLGWSLGGEKGKVELRVALGRKTWVSGQRIWCEVDVVNSSNKKIKSLALALLQTVQTFHPQPELDTSGRQFKRFVNQDSVRADSDACQTHTNRRKVNEEVLEAETNEKGQGRITGKGWWSGVEPGEVGHWDLSILAPPGMLSMRRTSLIEVTYHLRATVNGSIYVDVPVTLINFLSLDPPPMPRDLPRLRAAREATNRNSLKQEDLENAIHQRLLHMRSSDTMQSLNPAKASSTTLHLDALISAGRARAEAEGKIAEPANVRPTSLMSNYTSTPIAIQKENSSQPSIEPPGTARSRSAFSSRSREVESIHSGAISSEGPHDEDEEDRDLVAARRAQGRQRSLAVINQEMQDAKDIENAEIDGVDAMQDLFSPMDEVYRPLETPAEESLEFVAGSPTTTLDENMTPKAPITAVMAPMTENHIDVIPELDEPEETDDRPDATEKNVENVEDQDSTPTVEQKAAEEVVHIEHFKNGEDQDEEGDQTILDELVSHHARHDGDLEGPLAGEYGGYDYADDIEEGEEVEGDSEGLRPPSPFENVRRPSLPRQLPSLDIDPRLSFSGYDLNTDREAHVKATRSINGSFAVSTMSENESEVGQVVEAVKRNVSIKTPSRIFNLPQGQQGSEANEETASPKRRDSNFGPAPTSSGSGYRSINSIGSKRRPSVSQSLSPTKSSRDNSLSSRRDSALRGNLPLSGHGLGMKREPSNPPISSPLRTTVSPYSSPPSPEPTTLASPIRAAPSLWTGEYTAAGPASPLKIKTSVSMPRFPLSPSLSPRSAYPGQIQPHSAISPKGETMTRLPSATGSSLRHEMQLPPPRAYEDDASETAAPDLAPSIGSDTASSEEHPESPTKTEYKLPPLPALPALPLKGSAYEFTGLKEPSWFSAPDHLVSQQVNQVQISPHSTLDNRAREARMRSVRSHASSDDNHSIYSHETSASILPSVRTKIAQLESRDEALRKFSIASITGSVSSAVYAPPSPVKPRSPSGRKSYTAALAPRATQRSDSSEGLGGTTYVRPRVYREATTDGDHELDPFGIGHRRKSSIQSNSTTATSLEAGLNRPTGSRTYSSPPMSLRSAVSPRSRVQQRVHSPPFADYEDDSDGML